MEPNTATLSAQSGIGWKQISGLAALNAAIAISWIAYFNYQSRLLDQFGLTSLGLFLVCAQSAIMVVIPPVAGWIGDLMIRRNSNYFVVYTVGISVTAMIFMVVAFTLGFPVEVLKSIFPVMIIGWLISMNIFHSPANSMIELFAPAQDLPKVMAFLTVVTGLIMALEPIIIPIIDVLQAPLTFLAGGILLIITGYFFRKTTAQAPLRRKVHEGRINSGFGKVLMAGLLFGIVMSLVNNDGFILITDQKFATYRWNEFGTRHFISLVLFIAALLAFPASGFVTRKGLLKSLLLGTALTLTGFSLVAVFSVPFINIAGLVMMGAGISLAAVSSFPYALENLAPRHITFGTGIFFGCSELFTSLLNVYFAR